MPSSRIEQRVRDYFSSRGIGAQFDVEHRHGHDILQLYSPVAKKRFILGWNEQPNATVSYKGGNGYDKELVYEATSKIPGVTPVDLRQVAEGKLVAQVNKSPAAQ